MEKSGCSDRFRRQLACEKKIFCTGSVFFPFFSHQGRGEGQGAWRRQRLGHSWLTLTADTWIFINRECLLCRDIYWSVIGSTVTDGWERSQVNYWIYGYVLESVAWIHMGSPDCWTRGWLSLAIRGILGFPLGPRGFLF